MTWATDAQQLLDAAEAAGPEVSRVFLAPSGNFARDCSLLAVYLESVDVAPPARTNLPPELCVVVPMPHLVLVYVKDCDPALDESTSPAGPPPVADVTAWTTEFLEACQAIHAAALDALPQAQVLPAVTTGPTGQHASLQVRLRLMSLT